MNNSDFTYLLQNPNEVDATKISDIRSIIDQFPYFQSARALYLKGLKSTQSFKYNQELKTTAAYTTDRSVLFDFITSEEFVQNKVSEQIKRNAAHLRDIELVDIEDISVKHSVVIDNALRKQIKESAPILDPYLFEAKPNEEPQQLIEVETSKIEETAAVTLNIGQPLEFDKSEMHSFSEWLKITSFKPILRKEDSVSDQIEEQKRSPEDKSKKFDLIDKFIQSNPKIAPVQKDTPKQNIAMERTMRPDTLMTETLARIYLEQKNYKKAIQAYKILSLKYPEKSSFFADQIQEVKKLQKQNKA